MGNLNSINTDGWVYMFPGQGSQFIGMGQDFYEASERTREIFQLASDVSGKDIAKLCFRGPISKLSNTDNLQVALTTVNIAVAEHLRANGFPEPTLALGHSVGEYSAMYLCGVLSLEDALRAASMRGSLMQREAKKFKGVMHAVKLIEEQDLERFIAEEAPEGNVIIANDNSPRQQVIAGEKSAAAKVAARLGAEGYETVKLAVSGAWHSPLMEGCAQEFSECLANLDFSSPKIPLLANTDAELADDPDRMRSNLITHLTSKVLWQGSMRKMLDAGFTKFIEVGPKKVLSRLIAHIVGQENDLEIIGVETLAEAERLFAEIG